MTAMTAKHRVLVADDDRDLTESIAAYLGARGYEVITAASGTEAMAKVESGLPDVFVLDVMMDYDAEGLNLAYKLNNNERTRAIPIIILSGFLSSLGKKYDSFAFIQERGWPSAKLLQKPVQLSELAASIGRLLEESEDLRRVMANAPTA